MQQRNIDILNRLEVIPSSWRRNVSWTFIGCSQPLSLSHFRHLRHRFLATKGPVSSRQTKRKNRLSQKRKGISRKVEMLHCIRRRRIRKTAYISSHGRLSTRWQLLASSVCNPVCDLFANKFQVFTNKAIFEDASLRLNQS